MAKTILFNPSTIGTDEPILIKKGDGVVTTEGSGTNTIAQGNSTVPIYIGGKYAGYTVKNLDPSRGVEVIVDDSGNTKWLPYNVNERLVPYLNADGQLDLLGAVNAGITDPVDYANWEVTREMINQAKELAPYLKKGGIDAQQAYEDGIEITTIRSFVSDFVPRTDEPTDTIPTDTDRVNDSLKPYMDSAGSLNIFDAIANGITNVKDYENFNVTQKDIDTIQTLLKYRDEDGKMNVTKAVQDGVDIADIEKYVVVDKEALANLQAEKVTVEVETPQTDPVLEKASKFMTGNKLMVDDAIRGGMTDEELLSLGISKAAIQTAKETIEKTGKYAPYIKDGYVDVDKAVKELSDEELAELGVSEDLVKKAKLSAKYTDSTGFSVLNALRDDVSAEELKALGIKDDMIQDAQDYVALEKYGLDPASYDVADALKKGVPEDLLARHNDADSLAQAKKFIRLEKYYDASGKTNIEIARSKGATTAELRDMGFSWKEIETYDKLTAGMKTLTAGGYITSDGQIDVRKLYDDGKMNLLLDVNPEMTLSDISKIKNEFATIDKNYINFGNDRYILKTTWADINDTISQVGATSRERSQLLQDIVNENYDAFDTKLNKIYNDKVTALYSVDSSGNLVDYNYNSVSALNKAGKLDTYLDVIGVTDKAAWKQEFNDLNTIKNFVDTQNLINKRTDGTFNDYMWSASQNVLDAYNRTYGTNYDFGKYNELMSKSPIDQVKALVSDVKADNIFDFIKNTWDVATDYVGYIGQATPSTIGTVVTNFAKDKPELYSGISTAMTIQKKINPLYVSVNNAINGLNYIADKAGIDTATLTIGDVELGKIKDAETLVGTMKDAVFTIQDKNYETVHKEGRSYVEEQTLAIINEAGLNDLLLDPAAIVLTALDSGNKMTKGDVAEGLGEEAELAMSLLYYPFTLGKTVKENPTQGIAEIISIIIPGPSIGNIGKISKAASYATFGKISDITKAIAKTPDTSSAKTSSMNFVISGEKLAKTATLPLATGSIKEVNVQGFRTEDLGQMVGVGSVVDSKGQQVGYSRYRDKDGNITIQINATYGGKWDANANKLVWDTIQEVSHENKLLNDTNPAVTVVYGNLRVTSSPTGSKMSFVKGNTVHTVQASKNISPYDYSNDYKVTNMGIQVEKKGADAPLLSVKDVKAKDYFTDSTGKITVSNAPLKAVSRTETDYGKVAKIYAKDIAKTAVQVTKILVEPRFTKAMLKEVKTKIDSLLPKTFEDNYKALMQLTFALQAMKPEDAAKVNKWAERPEMKKLLDKGEYAKFVEIVGLDKVEVPKVWSKDWEAIYKDNNNPVSKEISRPLLSRIRQDITRFQTAQTKRYESTKKIRQAATKAVIPVLLATRMAMPASAAFDASKVVSRPRIEMVSKIDTKPDIKYDERTDTRTEVKPETTKTDTKVDVTPKLDETKLAELGKETKSNKPIKSEVSNTKTDVSKTSIGEISKQKISGKGTGAADFDSAVRSSKTNQTITDLAADSTKANIDATDLDVKADTIKDRDTTGRVESDVDIDTETKADTKAETSKTETDNIVQDAVQNVDSIVQDQLYDVSKVNTLDRVNTFGRRQNNRTNRTKITPKTPKLRFGSAGKDTGKVGKEKKGPVMVAWRQGSLRVKGRSKPVWIVIRKQGNQLVKSYEYKTPEGAPVSKGKAYQTLFHKGKKLRPFKVKVGFSKVTVDMSKSGKDRIQFKRDTIKYKLPTQKQLSRSKF